MIRNFEELQNSWESSKKEITSSDDSLNNLYASIKKKEKENFFFYYGTISILTITLIVISLFFYYVAPVKELLSKIGASLMIIGLLFRILVEVISIYKAKQINSLDKTLQQTENSIVFHQFRKTIHQVVAPVIIVLYTLGFYMITPEFSRYISFWNLVFIDVSYVIMGSILFVLIRRGVKKEMKIIEEIIALKNEIIQ
ncbi:hypothetical protein HN014_17700 [Aquimarina sp. TRL1]|uniref:hypothetical protein n=1 Tax=Aquimarina sp. (strain TRL1) TaxID=2736252 RepID=UPI00158BE1E7|nr:hypothetical protein [Aquimarina sp. TRL1]QKX06671.1 hypothetical protein HN014_17700 [Aquimarina sp. TRL1]